MFFTGSYCQTSLPSLTVTDPEENWLTVDWSTIVRFLLGVAFHISLSTVPLKAGPVIFTLKMPCSVLAVLTFWAIVVSICCPRPGVGVGGTVGVGFVCA